MAFTRFPDPTNNIANLANQPVEPPATLKQKFDQVGEDLKDWANNTFLPELESTTNGDSGADNIGATALIGGVATTVQGILEETDAKIISLLPFPDGSITNNKLATDVKVGSLASLSALLVGFTSSITVAINKLVVWIGDLSALSTTVKTSLVLAINELYTDKANKTQEAWITPTLINSWVEFDNVNSETQYFKDNFGIVHLKGLLKNGTVATAFILPSGYRPDKLQSFPIVSNTTGVGAVVDIYPDGRVNFSITTPTYRSLNGITFKAV